MRFYLFNVVDHSIQLVPAHVWYSTTANAEPHGTIVAMGNILRTQCDPSTDVVISTAFLGIDHNYMGGEPILFETMIFGGRFDGFGTRCSSYQEAEINHQKFVEMIQKDNLDAETIGIQQEIDLQDLTGLK